MKNYLMYAIESLAPNSDYVIFGDVYSGIEWRDKVNTKPTEAEINTKIAELQAAEPINQLRSERNNRLAQTDWRASSDLTISDAWKTYRQALRDLPASASPSLDSNYDLDLTSVTWPTEPS